MLASQAHIFPLRVSPHERSPVNLHNVPILSIMSLLLPRVSPQALPLTMLAECGDGCIANAEWGDA